MNGKGLIVMLAAAAWTCAAAPTPAGQGAPTFYRNIAPIIYQNCSTCHRPGESGPFSLLTYDDVKRHASQIADVTKGRFMPPWLPEPGHGQFEEERRLSDKQIQLIQAWVKAGAPAGSPASGPQPPKFSSEWRLGKPDLVLHVAQPYHLAANANETFWNFVIPVPITSTRWVKAMEVRPGNPRVFHHANVIIDRSGSARRKELVPGGGFEGMDLTVEEDTFDPDGHFLSWKPGSDPVVEPDGMAWRADPGMDLVLNVHLRPSGKEETVNPEIALYFTDKPQTKFPMLVQLEHDGSIDIPAGAKDFVVTDQFQCPLDVQVLAVYPHAHYLATLMEAYATLPDGSRKWLIRIPRWDLNWQGVYRLKEPMLLPKGSVVSMSYHYDNSSDNPRNPSSPPKEVKGGNRALDEMSHFWLQVLPVGDGDQRAVLQEALMNRRLQKYPGDFSANFNLGDLMMNQNNPAAAVPYFHIAAMADPNSAIAAGEYGAALFANGDPGAAEEQFKRALGLDPKYTDARYNLASVEANNAEWEAAASDFQKVLISNPDHNNARQHLGEVLFMWAESLAKSGDTARAVERYQDALVYRPDDPDLHAQLGAAFAQLGRFSDARAQFENVLKIDPSSQDAKDALTQIGARERLAKK
jgi:tetratricopeptide (TPR) repeat protein/mono/diheme cytochrome c family protein